MVKFGKKTDYDEFNVYAQDGGLAGRIIVDNGTWVFDPEDDYFLTFETLIKIANKLIKLNAKSC